MDNLDPKIGWQKYENVLEEQLTSTFFSDILQTIIEQHEEQIDEEENSETIYEDEATHQGGSYMVLARTGINQKLFDDLGMITNFDCWVGHTNFDITPKIKKDLDSVNGIEVLKIFSRYRFFIGVGKMFDFKNVRNNIENLLLKKGAINGHKHED